MLIALSLVLAAGFTQPTPTPSPQPEAAPTPAPAPTPAAKGEVVRLAFKWEPGVIGTYTTTIRQKTAYTGGLNGEIEQTQQAEADRVIAKSDDGKGVQVTDTLRRVAIAIKGGGGSIDFDTQRPRKEGEQLDILRDLLGRETRFVINADGMLGSGAGSVKGLSAAVDEARSRAAESPAAASILEQYKLAMGDDSLKRSLGELLALAPGKDVRVGESWETSSTVTLGSAGTLAIKTTHTLTASTPNPTIKSVSVLTHTPTSTAGPVTITVRDAAGEGEAVIDAARGVLLSRTYTLRMTLDTKSGDQISSQKIENTCEVRLKPPSK